MAKKCEIDRLSLLPDNILTYNIFSHLSLKEVVSTSVLSNSWRSLWKQITHLDLSEEFFESLIGVGSRKPRNPNLEQEVECINDIIDNILLLHCGHIERFSIHVTIFSYAPKIRKRLRVEQWIHRAALKEVKHMSLKACSVKLDIPSSLFACHLLRDLELNNFRFKGIPTEFDGFLFLQSCSLSHVDALTDDGLKQLIELCPLLHKLVLTNCFQLIDLKIQAPNLNSLNIVECYDVESLTADCPQLVELEINNCYGLIEFNMNSCVLFYHMLTSDVRIPKNLSMLNSLRKLSVKACPVVSNIDLVTTLGCFRNLEEVHIQIFEEDYCLEQESAKDDMVASLTLGEVVAGSIFPCLKKAYVDISSAIEEEEATMLAFLLNNAPSLNAVTVTLPYCREDIHDKEFTNKVLALQLIYEEIDIRIETDDNRLDATCRETYAEQGDRPDYLGNDFIGSDYNLLNHSPDFFPINFDDDHNYEWYHSRWC